MTTTEKRENTRKKRPASELNTMIYGKIPPHARDLEDAILGACLLEKDAFDVVSEILKPEAFYLEANQRVFRAMRSLRQRSEPVDLLTLVEQLKTTEELDQVGGPYYVVKLTNGVVGSANIETHCRIVLQKFIQRELIRISGETISDAYEDSADAFDLLDSHEKKFTEITTQNLQKSYTSISDELAKRVTRIEELRHSESSLTGIPSGFFDLDMITHGWQNTDLIILAARPSVGKTALALNFARNAASNSKKSTPVGFFSMEMSKGQLVDRLLAAEGAVDLEKISNGKMNDLEMQQLYSRGIQQLAKLPLFIDDSPALNIFQLRSKARNMKRRHDVGLIILDYLQLMSGTNERSNREQEISKISRDLKALAKELVIPIIALSQLSREPEKRKGENKMPQLSDLRESGAIEQDADAVLFIYRPEYHDQHANEWGESTSGETNIRIAKHRNGKLDNVKLIANLSIQKFSNYDKLQEVKKNLGEGKWKPALSMGSKMTEDELPFD